MCGRFALTTVGDALLEQASIVFGREIYAPEGTPPPHTNIAPTSTIAVVNGKDLLPARWGLIPHWAKEVPKGSLFNARVETMTSKPSYRSAVKHGRCVIPMDGYYEWHDKVQHTICAHDGAMLWAAAIADNGLGQRSVSMLTQASRGSVEWVHHRMPVLLSAEQAQSWVAEGELMLEATLDDLAVAPTLPTSSDESTTSATLPFAL